MHGYLPDQRSIAPTSSSESPGRGALLHPVQLLLLSPSLSCLHLPTVHLCGEECHRRPSDSGHGSKETGLEVVGEASVRRRLRLGSHHPSLSTPALENAANQNHWTAAELREAVQGREGRKKRKKKNEQRFGLMEWAE